MKSCLGLFFILLVFTAVAGTGALIWYLSDTAEFSRNGAAHPASPPKAAPVRPHSTAPGREPAKR